MSYMFTISPTQRKAIQILSYYVLPILLAVSAVTWVTDSVFVLLGQAALLAVTANLFIKPVSVIYPHPLFALALTFRRELGVASFWMYLFHAMGMFLGRGLSLDMVYNPQGFIIWGAVASIGMWILGLTSNNLSQRLLKRNWKKVQMVAYAVLPIASFHASKAEGEYAKFILITGSFIILKTIQYVITQKRMVKPAA